MTKKTSTKGLPEKSYLTVDRLHHLLDYDSATGVFTWRVTGRGIKHLGAVAGAKSDSGCGKTYLKIRIDDVLYYGHRLAWFWTYGVWPKDQLDHIDGDGLNNAISNLRECNQTQNLGNVGRRKRSKEKYKGITKSGKKWLAQIRKYKQHQFLGCFENPVDAARSYDKAAISIFGEFAKTNASMGLI